MPNAMLDDVAGESAESVSDSTAPVAERFQRTACWYVPP